MKKIILTALAVAAYSIGLASPSGAAAQMVTAQDPQTVRALFERWGYRPAPISASEGSPVMQAEIGEVRTSVGFGGCTNGLNCDYLVMIAIYNDVANPPFEWLNTQNSEYDLVTLTRADNGMLSLRASIMLGTQGVPESTLRAVIDDWIAANGEIAQRAVQAGLAPAAPAQ